MFVIRVQHVETLGPGSHLQLCLRRDFPLIDPLSTHRPVEALLEIRRSGTDHGGAAEGSSAGPLIRL